MTDRVQIGDVLLYQGAAYRVCAPVKRVGNNLGDEYDVAPVQPASDDADKSIAGLFVGDLRMYRHSWARQPGDYSWSPING